ncbi:hypothetical protein J437_LFUL003987 [Ladona fulva]|uniref:Uncharacterized protein n=1 Tax=Ladona fulva TaxID=123851 RepID=A0A8K0NYZ8_LADFU|nr:hypothetical protein J437_LFUL003987 [Ladona fulva]
MVGTAGLFPRAVCSYDVGYQLCTMWCSKKSRSHCDNYPENMSITCELECSEECRAPIITSNDDRIWRSVVDAVFLKVGLGNGFSLVSCHLWSLTAHPLEQKECVLRALRISSSLKTGGIYYILIFLDKKPTFCDHKDTLQKLCGQIGGDATLYSMFRANAKAVHCPFRGPFTFTYNRGNGECGQPVSRVDSCTEESRLLLRYQACPDIHGTESTVEELVCLATWKDGSTRYLVGMLERMMATSNEDRYRCFVYDRKSRGDRRVTIEIAQSGDATCNGLLTATEGSRTMRLTKVENHSSRCRYPSWVTEHHHWHTLDSQKSFHFSHKNATMRISNATAPQSSSPPAVPTSPALSAPSPASLSSSPEEEGGGGRLHKGSAGGRRVGAEGVRAGSGAQAEMHVVCHSIEETSEKQVTLVTHVTMGCQSGYVCMVFYRRDAHVIELQQSSNFARVPEEACSPLFFNPVSLPYITLITEAMKPRKCPYLGRYTITGVSRGERDIGLMFTKGEKRSESMRDRRELKAVAGGQWRRRRRREVCSGEDFDSLVVGCSASDTMEFHSSCNPEAVSAYSCHGSWEDNGTNYLIASPVSRKSVGARRYCFIYTETESGDKKMLQFSSVADTCLRNPSPTLGEHNPSSGIWAFNVTVNGQCAEASTSADSGKFIQPEAWLVFSISLVLSCWLSGLR